MLIVVVIVIIKTNPTKLTKLNQTQPKNRLVSQNLVMLTPVYGFFFEFLSFCKFLGLFFSLLFSFFCVGRVLGDN